MSSHQKKEIDVLRHTLIFLKMYMIDHTCILVKKKELTCFTAVIYYVFSNGLVSHGNNTTDEGAHSALERVGQW